MLWWREHLIESHTAVRASGLFSSSSIAAAILSATRRSGVASKPYALGRRDGLAGLLAARRQGLAGGRSLLYVESVSLHANGTVDTRQRAPIAAAVDVVRLEALYWDAVRRVTLGWVRFSEDALRLLGGSPVLLRFGPLVEGRRTILGGWFARRPGGTIEWRADGIHVSVEVVGFVPLLRGPLWRIESWLHDLVGRRFLARVAREAG